MESQGEGLHADAQEVMGHTVRHSPQGYHPRDTLRDLRSMRAESSISQAQLPSHLTGLPVRSEPAPPTTLRRPMLALWPLHRDAETVASVGDYGVQGPHATYDRSHTLTLSDPSIHLDGKPGFRVSKEFWRETRPWM